MSYKNLGIDIRDVQLTQLEILLEFDRICKKHNIKYQLFAGSLLGAIRHKGFIPWDDDIDVCLLRKDYDKFIEVSQRELNSNYFLQTKETDENCMQSFGKIRKNGTLFVEYRTAEYTNTHQGIYIDIFPLDNVLPKTWIGEYQRLMIHLIDRINRLRVRNICMTIDNNFLRSVSLLLNHVVKLVPKKWIDKLHHRLVCMFNDRETTYVSHLLNGVSKTRYIKYMMKSDEFYNITSWEFENHLFPVPQSYDLILNRLFKDYMKLPPKNEQKPHHGIVKVSFNTNQKVMGE